MQLELVVDSFHPIFFSAEFKRLNNILINYAQGCFQSKISGYQVV